MDIKQLLKDRVKVNALIQASKYSKEILVHTKGEGLQAFLAQINGYENRNQYLLRQKHAISNKFVTSKLLRPVDNIWRSKGSSISIEVGATKPEEFLKNTRPIDGYLHDTWLDAFISDPNGVSLITLIDKDKKEIRVTYIPVNDIYHIALDNDKIKELLYLVEIRTTTDEDGKDTETYIYEYYDEDKYIKYEVTGDKITEEEAVNEYKIVPAVINSTIKSIDTNYYISAIDAEIELLNSFVRKNSVKEIFEFLHGYPKFWQFVEHCDTCNGAKKIEAFSGAGEARTKEFVTCPKCDGLGHFGQSDVSDALNIAMPEDGENAIGNAPMGFEIPPTDTWQEMRVELDWFWDIIFNSQWGTTVVKGENETATGRFIDVQPVMNRLNHYADQLERVTNGLYNIAGIILFPNQFEKFHKSVGRRFIIEPTEIALQRYNDAKEKGDSYTVLNNLLEQYYTNEFQTDAAGFEIAIKLMKVEPYVHNTIAEVTAMTIPEKYKIEKYLFPLWLDTITNEDILKMNIANLKASFDAFIKLNTDAKI